MNAILITGATNQVGYYLLPQLTDYQVYATYRTKPQFFHAPLKHVHWLNIDDLTTVVKENQPHIWISMSPLHLMPKWLQRYVCIQRIIVFSSSSILTKRHSKDKGEKDKMESMRVAEQAIISMAEKHHIQWTIFRPTMIYGSNMDENVSTIARFINKTGFFVLPGKATGLRQPVHAEDLARASVAVIDNAQTFNKTYYLTGGETLTYRKMVTMIFKAMHKKPVILTIPLVLFRYALRLLSLHPRYAHLNEAMAWRINQDLVFSHQPATQDFNYKARTFNPPHQNQENQLPLS